VASSDDSDRFGDHDRFQRAIAAIDAGNADDPNVVTIRGRTGPKEVLHAELVSIHEAQSKDDPLLLRMLTLPSAGDTWNGPQSRYAHVDGLDEYHPEP